MRIWRTHDEGETRALGAELARELLPAGCLLLEGGLGAGKTVLTQGLAKGLGFSATEIQSPTYSLVHEYKKEGVRFIHADLFRLDVADVEAMALEELLAGPGVKVVEWAERLPFPVAGSLKLIIDVPSETVREIRETEGD